MLLFHLTNTFTLRTDRSLVSKSLFTFAGIINAQTGTIEETWDGLPEFGIPAVIGNQNSGQQIVNIDVGKNGRVCEHKDDSRRIEVRIEFW